MALGRAFTPKIAGEKRMGSPTQVAAVVIWAALSACICSSSCNLALAAPVAAGAVAGRRFGVYVFARHDGAC